MIPPKLKPVTQGLRTLNDPVTASIDHTKKIV